MAASIACPDINSITRHDISSLARNPGSYFPFKERPGGDEVRVVISKVEIEFCPGCHFERM